MRYEEVLANFTVNADECWVWMGGRCKTRYGRVIWGGTLVSTHRLLYELFREKIEPGLVINHICRNKHCANPFHLEAVPEIINLLDEDTPAGRNLRKTHCKRGHPLSGDNLRIRIQPGKNPFRCCTICERENWKRQARKKHWAKKGMVPPLLPVTPKRSKTSGRFEPFL